ncbi:MAG TPA: hypothetical protein DCR43_05785 [Bacteroidales bacterium]|nr:MAG: hypothetical protein A2X11_03050 [Bacteroidetes bacterium GWE2_42_24]OFY28411.1 MAG: hypothetical protein A2X09_15005 [Bacteroidetes bacterium GWF2_43_11]PKP19472.1 MAG: hypothetical protein CVU06_11315 [Bacteroidetes bacterium HGW-Bacteroidetes-22]HAQ65346.1 hypothetical protein [Bacteroidales bacterium]HBZ65461.1 hypothetical protein [Bacteroidales bacterium]
MATFIHCKNPLSEDLGDQLKAIPECPGTCIFIDIINSTDLKYRAGIETWGRMLNNTFNFISFLNNFPENIVKGIGDEMMLYIPDSELRQKKDINSYFALLGEIFATLDNIKNHPLPDLFLQCKVAIHHSTDVYNITFLKGANDYYGRGIDLSARFMQKGRPNRIVMSQDFYELVLADAQEVGKADTDAMLKMVSPIYHEDFKGVPFPVAYRFIDLNN